MKGHKLREFLAPITRDGLGIVSCECGWAAHWSKAAGGLVKYQKHVDEVRSAELNAKVLN